MNRNQLKSCGKKAQVHLIKKLLGTIPELLDEIIPQGFENSIYYKIYRPSLEKDYRLYREKRATEFLQAKFWKHRYTYKPLLSLTQFKKTYITAPKNTPSEILAVLAEAIRPILCSYHMVYDQKRNNYSITYDTHFEEYFIIAANRLTIFNGQHFTEDELFNRHIYEEGVDLGPMLCFIFKQLKRWKIDFYYEKKESPYIIGFINFIEQIAIEVSEVKDKKELIEYDPETALLKELSIDKEEQELMHKENLLRNAENIAPCGVVNAYIEVYGDFPDGFL